jgi:aspartyl-tRNA(Asn)/glutamyl-tRNA(Gln) amidotransferase subunit C
MTIAKEMIQRVATLARLALSQEETSLFSAQLDNILSYVELLNEIDNRDVEETLQVIPMNCPLRADEVTPSLPREQMLASAPRHHEEFFLVPKIIE